jgi:hypothetical protein
MEKGGNENGRGLCVMEKHDKPDREKRVLDMRSS